MRVVFLMMLIPVMLFSTNLKNKFEASTELEKIKGVKGTILVKGYEQISKTIYGKYGFSLNLTVYEFKNVKTKKNIYGLGIEIDNGKEYDSSASSFIDYDEINSLVKGLEYIKGITKNPTKLKNYEASYKTKGSLNITSFNSKNGNLVAIQVGSYSRKTIYLKPKKLEEIKNIIIKAKEKIESNKKR